MQVSGVLEISGQTKDLDPRMVNTVLLGESGRYMSVWLMIQFKFGPTSGEDVQCIDCFTIAVRKAFYLVRLNERLY